MHAYVDGHILIAHAQNCRAKLYIQSTNWYKGLPQGFPIRVRVGKISGFDHKQRHKRPGSQAHVEESRGEWSMVYVCAVV